MARVLGSVIVKDLELKISPQDRREGTSGLARKGFDPVSAGEAGLMKGVENLPERLREKKTGPAQNPSATQKLKKFLHL